MAGMKDSKVGNKFTVYYVELVYKWHCVIMHTRGGAHFSCTHHCLELERVVRFIGSTVIIILFSLYMYYY